MSAHNSREQLSDANFEVQDPGAAGKIIFSYTLGVCHLVTAAAEARTLVPPNKAGLRACLYMRTDGGDCTVTAPAALNQAGNTIMTFNDVGDMVHLVSVRHDATTFRWKITSNDGATLS